MHVHAFFLSSVPSLSYLMSSYLAIGERGEEERKHFARSEGEAAFSFFLSFIHSFILSSSLTTHKSSYIDACVYFCGDCSVSFTNGQKRYLFQLSCHCACTLSPNLLLNCN